MTFEILWWELMINTWIVMGLLVVGSWLVTRRMTSHEHPVSWQNYLEAVVEAIQEHIYDITRQDTRPHLAFIGSLFLFVLTANLLTIFPALSQLIGGLPAVYHPPTASLDTTAALAVGVFLAVPFFSISRYGLKHYLATYLQPSPFLLPFNIIGELSRTLALAMRLFGNMMSGVVVAAILLSIAPFLFPVILQLFGLVTGTIQAYIFAVLAMVYIASAARTQHEARDNHEL